MGEGEFIDAFDEGEIHPGSMRCREIAGRHVLVANVEGALYAVDATCTHEDASLCDGSLRGHRVGCPLHGSRFDLRTGEPLEDPAEAALAVHEVRVSRGRVQIRLRT